MADQFSDVEKRLNEAPVMTGDPSYREQLVSDHMAYSLWRIANALEQQNELQRDQVAWLRNSPQSTANAGGKR